VGKQQRKNNGRLDWDINPRCTTLTKLKTTTLAALNTKKRQPVGLGHQLGCTTQLDSTTAARLKPKTRRPPADTLS